MISNAWRRRRRVTMSLLRTGCVPRGSEAMVWLTPASFASSTPGRTTLAIHGKSSREWPHLQMRRDTDALQGVTMLVVTTENVPGYRVREVKGQVFGVVVTTSMVT